mgnify:CR=1 FL=1
MFVIIVVIVGVCSQHNLFEDIASYLCEPGGATNCRGQAPRALHSDDGMSGWTVIANHFRNGTRLS